MSIQSQNPGCDWRVDIFGGRHTYAPTAVEPLTGPVAIMLGHCASSPATLADLAQASLAGEVIHACDRSGGGPEIYSANLTAVLLPLCDSAQKELWYQSLVSALASKRANGFAGLDASAYEVAKAAFEAHEPDFAMRWVSHAYPMFAEEIKSKGWPARDTMEAFLQCPGKSPEHIEQAVSIFRGVCTNPALMWKEAWDTTTGIKSSCMRLPCPQAIGEMFHPDLLGLANIPSLLERSLNACWLGGMLHSIQHPAGAKRLQDNLDWLLDPEMVIGMVCSLKRLASRNKGNALDAVRFDHALALVDGLVRQGPDWLADRVLATDFTSGSDSESFPVPANLARINKMQMAWSTHHPRPHASRSSARL